MTDEAKRIVEALRMCPVSGFKCEDCPVYNPGFPCQNELEAADLIESLSAELEQVKQERDGLNILLTQSQSMLETRTRERDALMTDLSKSRLCRTCVFYGDGDYISNDCFDCVNRCNWQWRGVKED